jgi:hypothetical protein
MPADGTRLPVVDSGEFGRSPFLGQLAASKAPDRDGTLRPLRANAYRRLSNGAVAQSKIKQCDTERDKLASPHVYPWPQSRHCPVQTNTLEAAKCASDTPRLDAPMSAVGQFRISARGYAKSALLP